MSLLKIRGLIEGVQLALDDLKGALDDLYTYEKVREMIKEGMEKGRSIRAMSRDLGIPKSTIHKISIQHLNQDKQAKANRQG
tara:strand:+ start:189 stop:434 length:246 start_codon:yes stop_codon:yes gene_type:complete